MSISDTKKLDILWKKVIHGVTETDPLNKDGINEAISSKVLTLSHEIWADAANIPTTPPNQDTSIIKGYLENDPISLTVDPTAVGHKAWIARDSSGVRLTDWIPPSLGSDYLVQVYTHSSLTSDCKLNPLHTNQEWVFDYSSGVLVFPVCVPTSIQDLNSLYLIGYRYIGKKGFLPSEEDEGTVVPSIPQQYEIAGTAFGSPAPDEVVMRFVAASRFKLPVNMLLSQGKCKVQPNHLSIFKLTLNGGFFGRMIFNPNSLYSSFDSVEVMVLPRDELLVLAPSVRDTTISDIEWTLVGQGY